MSKRYNEAVKLIEQGKTYPIEEAIKLAKETSLVKFDAAVDVHIKLNIDPQQTDQKLRLQVQLPHGTGQTVKVAAFVTPAKEKEAKEAGADIVGGEELVKQIRETEKTDFDLAVAMPAMMKSLTTIAKILGQRGLMPSPKTGTIGEDIAKTIRETKSGKVDVKTDDSGNIHEPIGRVSFAETKLIENFNFLKEAIVKGKPGSVKKEFIRSVTISTSMGPGIRIGK